MTTNCLRYLFTWALAFTGKWWDHPSILLLHSHFCFASIEPLHLTKLKSSPKKQYTRTNNDLIYFWLGCVQFSSGVVCSCVSVFFFACSATIDLFIWFQVRAADILPFTWNERDNSFFVLRIIHRAVNNNTHAACTKAQVDFFFSNKNTLDRIQSNSMILTPEIVSVYRV